jgi:hypothetical protein
MNYRAASPAFSNSYILADHPTFFFIQEIAEKTFKLIQVTNETETIYLILGNRECTGMNFVAIASCNEKK